MNLRTSDLAVCTETSEFSIRSYSDQGLLGPVPRAESSNYRTFDPRLIPQVYLLRALREMGFSFQQLTDFGQNRTPRLTREVFRHYSEQLSLEVSRLQSEHDMLESYLSFIEEGQSTTPGSIEVRQLPERRIFCSSLEKYSSKMNSTKRLRQAFGQIRLNGNAGCPLGFSYNDFFDFLEKSDQPSQLISFDPQGPDVRPAGEYLIGTESCYYGETGGLPRRMFEYALYNNIEFIGPAFTVYLLDAASVTGPEQYLLQVAVQIKRQE